MMFILYKATQEDENLQGSGAGGLKDALGFNILSGFHHKVATTAPPTSVRQTATPSPHYEESHIVLVGFLWTCVDRWRVLTSTRRSHEW